MVQGEKYANSCSSNSQPTSYKSDESKRNGFMALQKQKPMDQRCLGSTGSQQSKYASTSSATSSSATTSKNVWGPYFKNKDDFVNMHFS